MKKPTYLCIHGHFYQPPRENPWLEAVERQESAAPWHDWNDRIASQCYQPNTLARIYDSDDQVAEVVNTYEYISFNIGPTLFSWLEAHRPKAYHSILEADKKSAVRNGGHGNAIAQVYNHMIMPLANRRDQETQVRWGKADFTHRFGREPEAMWLPETACNAETLRLLAREGMTFALLAPGQALRCRPLEGGNWQEVSDGSIDPTRAYRCYLNPERTQSLDLFFYDGPISGAVGFEEILANSGVLADRLEQASSPTRGWPELIHVVTDGETYGHHKPFGDRVLAHLLTREAPDRGFEITNYGKHLEDHPPQWEVEIKPGADGLGTAWSCAHGVGRWMTHCGCRGDGPPEWTQHWRGPLRDSFNWLRDRMIPLFESGAARYFRDPWAARDDYIQVVLDRSPQRVDRFFAHAMGGLEGQRRIEALLWMEQQRNAMLLFTSCAWFFTEISGIETIQVMKYAARAIQITRQLTGVDLEPEFLNRLEAAPSNDPQYATGRGVYEQMVRPAIVTPARIAAQFAIGGLFHPLEPSAGIYNFMVESHHHRQEERDDLSLITGLLTLEHRTTGERTWADYALLRVGQYDIRFSARTGPANGSLPSVDVGWEKSLYRQFVTGRLMDLLRLMDVQYGEEFLSFEDLFMDEKRDFLARISQKNLRRLHKAIRGLYMEFRRLAKVYRSAHLTPPPEYELAAEYHLQSRLLVAIRRAEGGGVEAMDEMGRVLEEVNEVNLIPDVEGLRRNLETELRLRMEELAQTGNWRLISTCKAILDLAEKAGVQLDLLSAQDSYLGMLRDWREGVEPSPLPLDKTLLEEFIGLGEAIHIAAKSWMKTR